MTQINLLNSQLILWDQDNLIESKLKQIMKLDSHSTLER
jgi:hypothetical protein